MEGTVKRAFGLMPGLLTPEAGESPRNVGAPRYDRPMSAAPSEPAPQYPHATLGGEESVTVPLATLRRLEAIERHAPAEVIAEAEAEEAEIAGRKQAASARWDEVLGSASPGLRAWADREAARLIALNK